jgi:hypothetical protein
LLYSQSFCRCAAFVPVQIWLAAKVIV